ncbi:hypothetical protein DBV15_09539, partial [Temnothorax longispinosus]
MQNFLNQAEIYFTSDESFNTDSEWLIRTGGDEETVSEPRLEETIFGGLVDVDMARQDDLNVARVHQEDQQLWSEPQLDDLIVLERLSVQVTKHGCNRDIGVHDRPARELLSPYCPNFLGAAAHFRSLAGLLDP